MLKNKVAVIYGAGGGIGGRCRTRVRARRGQALSHRAPHRTRRSGCRGIASAGGSTEAAEVDALDDEALDTHLQSVIEKAGRIDISFNAIGIPNTTIVGVPLTELNADCGKGLQIAALAVRLCAGRTNTMRSKR